jgi:hypothetical protein
MVAVRTASRPRMIPMANHEHVALLKQGVAAWNVWRQQNPDTEVDLRGINLTNFMEMNLIEANLRRADLSGADLSWVKLNGADLSGAILYDARLYGAKLPMASLPGANLRRADLSGADLSGANLRAADLTVATLVETDLTGADLTGCFIYGISAWGLKLEGAKQQNLVITRGTELGYDMSPGSRWIQEAEPELTVDKIAVAQFIYLLYNNQNIRDVIDTIGKKGVLLLGRFTEGRMVVLERLREKLRELGFLPMVFNFKPETKDFTETVRLLANLSKFVIVDITNPRSAPLELQATVPDYMVPFVPILQQGEEPFAMFVDLQNKYDWVLQPVVGYPSVERLIEVLEDKVVRPAEAKFNELLTRRTKQLRVENIPP